jgi:UPF0755 protein
MNNKKKMKISLYQYLSYIMSTFILLILAVPLAMIRFPGYLIRPFQAPFKSVRDFIRFALVLLIIAAVAIAGYVFLPYDIGPERRSVMINENDAFNKVISDLKEREIVRGIYLFKLMAVASGIDKNIRPGRYDFSGRISLYSIYKKFKNHDIATVLITIPEGLTVYRIAGIFSRQLEIDSAAFVARAFDTAFTESKYHLNGLEGYLFPDSYLFWYGISIDAVIDRLVSEFHHRTDSLFGSPSENRYSKTELVTLASIIEAEAYRNDEKSLISSVYYNRLKSKMLLQADPTVIYSLGGLERRLNYRDLKYDSPYNTYKYKGLPPGPINSPGLDAIEAAIAPDSTDFYYFVADGTGGHIFSRTLQEHNRAKYRVKKSR